MRRAAIALIALALRTMTLWLGEAVRKTSNNTVRIGTGGHHFSAGMAFEQGYSSYGPAVAKASTTAATATANALAT